MAQALVYDRHGNVIEGDDAIVPDGGRISVAPRFMDHLPPEARRAFQQLHDHTARDAQGFERGHRPGFADVEHGVYTYGEESPAAKARKKWLERLGEAWRWPAPPLLPLQHDAKPANSKSERLSDLSSKPRDREAAWKAYVERTKNAWKD
jgi:hypothetical protein